MSEEKSLEIYDQKVAVDRLSTKALALSIDFIRAVVPEVNNPAHLNQIAVDMITYGIIPGRDVYYFANKGKLARVEDYAYMMRVYTQMVRLESGNPAEEIKDTYYKLSDEEKAAELLPEKCLAYKCTVQTKQDASCFETKISKYIQFGFDPVEALEIVERLNGSPGSFAIGVAYQSEYAPNGMSLAERARIRALKNALRRRFGNIDAETSRLVRIDASQKKVGACSHQVNSDQDDVVFDEMYSNVVNSQEVVSVDDEAIGSSSDVRHQQKLQRPLPPNVLKEAMHKKANRSENDGPASQKMIGLLAGKLEQAIGGDDPTGLRHKVLAWLWDGTRSTRELSGSQVRVMLDWLLDRGTNDVHKDAIVEVKSVVDLLAHYDDMGCSDEDLFGKDKEEESEPF